MRPWIVAAVVSGPRQTAEMIENSVATDPTIIAKAPSVVAAWLATGGMTAAVQFPERIDSRFEADEQQQGTERKEGIKR